MTNVIHSFGCHRINRTKGDQSFNNVIKDTHGTQHMEASGLFLLNIVSCLYIVYMPQLTDP